MNSASDARKMRRQGLMRSALITYGVAAFGYFFSRYLHDESVPALGGVVSAHAAALIGLALQLALLAGRLLIKRHAADPEVAIKGYYVIEVIGDGVTVFLFALATFGALLRYPGDV
jgi:hypothetical protein